VAFYIEMFKEHESRTGVRYRAEMTVAGEPYAWKAGKVRYHLVRKVGVFEFEFATEEMAFLEERSDDVFLEDEGNRMRCFMKMRQCLRAGQFPGKVEWAS
jgi:hypothetical protein